ncbi:MAG: hypothetical protein ABI743_02530 [bacterium]
MPVDPKNPDDYDELIAEVTREYETHLHDDLGLANAREEALAAERATHQEPRFKSDSALGPDPPPIHLPEAGPATKRYEKMVDAAATAGGRSFGTGYSIAMVFVAYPIAGVILGTLIDRYVIARITGHDSFWGILICLIAGVYNGILEALRLNKKMAIEQAEEKAERRGGGGSS